MSAHLTQTGHFPHEIGSAGLGMAENRKQFHLQDQNKDKRGKISFGVMPISQTPEHLTPKITARIKRVSIKASDLIVKSQTRIIPLFSPSSSRESKLLLFHNKTSSYFKDLHTTMTGEHTNHP